MLRRFDDFLLDRVAQPFSDWLGRTFGLSPYLLAAHLYLADSALAVPRAVFAMQAARWFDFGLYGISAGYAAVLARRAHRIEGQTAMNRVRVEDGMFRPLFALLFVATLVRSVGEVAIGAYAWPAVLADVGGALFTSALYLSAVRRPPPFRREPFGRGLAHGGSHG